jgi:hypothetical protein
MMIIFGPQPQKCNNAKMFKPLIELADHDIN